jgi:restriction system protein
MHISDEELTIENPGGGYRFENDVAWARFYLVRAGFLDSSRRGVWSLTELGRTSPFLTDQETNELIRRVQLESRGLGGVTDDATEDQLERVATEQAERVAVDIDEVPRSYRERALGIMLSLPPAGFERLCQRLLRESGFQQVKVTGRSGDGGIDGIGVLQVNPFVSFKVLFQCKRWASVVGPSVIRDFRGAMMGRADKGLVLTTGTFSADAQAEAVRDGASPIELVDGSAFVTLLEQLELGLIPRTTYEVDTKFFDEFSR